MKRFLFLVAVLLMASTCRAQSTYVRLVTTKGNITLLLYDQTPKHRDAFLQSIRNGLYNDAAFNRVIKSFVSQAGELDETILEREKLQPELPLKRIEAEIIPDLYHKKGALGAGRNENPEKSSYLTQIYLVAGKIQTDEQLNRLEQKNGRKFPPKHREIYKTIGGTPHLDQNYTVFGEIVEGMDVAEAINSMSVNKNDHPLVPINFTPKILSKKEVAVLTSGIN